MLDADYLPEVHALSEAILATGYVAKRRTGASELIDQPLRIRVRKLALRGIKLLGASNVFLLLAVKDLGLLLLFSIAHASSKANDPAAIRPVDLDPRWSGQSRTLWVEYRVERHAIGI